MIETTFLEKPPDEKTLRTKILAKIAALPEADRTLVLLAFKRYEAEAAKGSYVAEPDALVKFILAERLLEDTDEFFDLGAGPGDLLRALALSRTDIRGCGIDLSPGFAAAFNAGRRPPNAAMDVDLIDRPMDIPTENSTAAISVLTLDRLTEPMGLIRNMAKFTKAKILGTLLPVVAEDDNPSRQGSEKIIYTLPEKRIVPGKTNIEDRDVLLKLLRKTWRAPVAFEEVPYVVTSSGDRQAYPLGVFYTPSPSRR